MFAWMGLFLPFLLTMRIVINYTLDVASQKLDVHVPQTHHVTWIPLHDTLFESIAATTPICCTHICQKQDEQPTDGAARLFMMRTLLVRFVSIRRTYLASSSVLHTNRLQRSAQLPSQRFGRRLRVPSSGDSRG